MSKSGRLLAILNLIRTHRSITADSLAEKCSVSERTIYRDLATLSDVGAPVYFDNGYKLLPGFFLPPLNLSVAVYLTFQLPFIVSPPQSFRDARATLSWLPPNSTVSEPKSPVDRGPV